jgi:IPT/TIG domain
VVIAGEGFVEGCAVRVAGAPVPARFVSAQRLEASLPAIDVVGSVDVEVVNPDSQSCRLEAAFELRGPPRLSAVQPPQGSDAGGEILTLTGLDLERGCEVSIGGFPARTTWEAESTVRAVAPSRALAGPVDVVLTNPDGQSAVLESAFTYVARQPPVILGIAPTTGPTTGGTGVLVRGEHLDSVTQVLVGGRLAAGFKVRGGELAFVTPPRSRDGAADLELRTRDGAITLRKNAFQYAPVPPPTIRSIAPNRGGTAGGTEVTVAGEHFVPGAIVLVEGEPVAATRVRDASSIVFTTPPGEAGVMVDVVVRSPTGQEAVAKRAFLYDPRYR